jgi:hypothetical protein
VGREEGIAAYAVALLVSNWNSYITNNSASLTWECHLG